MTTFDKVGSFACRRSRPTGSPTTRAPAAPAAAAAADVAARGGRGGAGGGQRRGRRRPRRRRHAAARNASREKRKDPGSDLILRNLATGEEVTIPEVTEYEWNRNGTWLAYAVSSTDAAKDGAFARQIATASVKTLHAGTRPLQEPHVRRGRHADRVPQRQGGVRASRSSPYRLYYWKAGDAAATEIVSASTAGMPKGMVVSENARAALLAGRRAPLPRHRRRRRPRRADPNDKTPEPIKVDLWSYKDPLLQPMQQVRAEQERQPQLPRGRPPRRQAVRPARDAGPAERERRRRSDAARSARRTCPTGRRCRGTRPTTTSILLDLKTGKPKKVLEHWGSAATSMSPGGKYVLLLRRAHRPLVHLPRRRRHAREPHREVAGQASSRRTTRPTCPAPTAPAAGRPTTSRCCSTTSSTSGK